MKYFKKVLAAVLVGASLLALAACGEKKETINVYNFGDYIDADVLKLFEEETGIRVVYDTFANNEDAYVKLRQGGSNYDVVIISDYTIERSIKEELLQPINWDNVPNLSEVDEDFLNPIYDPEQRYHAPYMWGTLGIIYNTTLVDDVVDSWDILWDAKYDNQIVMLNSQRDTLGVSLIRLGYSMNSRNLDELEEAKQALIAQRPLVYAYLGDDIKDTLIAGDAALGIIWSGDAMYMMDENPDLAYVVPKEGSNLWFDSMVIPTSVRNQAAAEQFINFMLRPDIALMNADYIGYSTPITRAVEQLEDEVRFSDVAYPSDELIATLEIFRDPSDMLEVYDRIWTEILSSN